MGDGQLLEVEVKFFVADLTAVREKLCRMTACHLKTARLYERNVVFDTAVETLRHNQQLLRLRQDENVRLTFKGPAPAQQALSQAKVREEIEVTLDNFDHMSQLLQRLGFQPVLVYEKYRETFVCGEVEVVLDELPYGHFVELEGPEMALRSVAGQLDLAWDKRLLSNYLAMLTQVQAEYELPFSDLTFANFADITVDGTKLWGKGLSG